MRWNRLLTLAVLAGPLVSGQWTSIDPPAASGSGMPFFASAPDGSVYLSWTDPAGDSGHALRYSRWTGTAWSNPETVAQGKGWFVNWADFPALQVLADGSMLAHWLVRAEAGGQYGYGIRVARRGPGPDGTWTQTVALNENDPADYAGFLSFSGASAAYLSPPASRAPHAGHAADGHGEDHIKTLRFIRFAADGKAETDEELDADVCSCCQTATVQTGSGILVAYRDHLPGEIRDISLVRYRNGGWSPPVPLHQDGWKINGCPTEGPSMVASGDTVSIAWMTRAGDVPRLQVALSRDQGQHFRTPLRADDGNPLGRPALVSVDERQSLLVWLEKTDAGAEVRLRRIFSNGTRAASMKVATVAASRTTGLPRIAVFRDHVLVAWRDGRVRASRVPLESIPRKVLK